MSLKLIYITNDANLTKIAEDSGVDWILIDLEIRGKQERQKGFDSFISKHCIEDVKKIKQILTKAELCVRVNPIFNGSRQEIDKVIQGGADIVMLPFFKNQEEVKTFVEYVAGRSKVCLLFETSQAVNNIDSILSVPGIDYVHIGLNDLHISYEMKFMFEPMTDGTVEYLCNKFRNAGIPYGIGGIAALGKGQLPAENIIIEHYRLGSGRVILSRSFFGTTDLKDIHSFKSEFKSRVDEVKLFESQIAKESTSFFEANYKIMCKKVDVIKKGLCDESTEKR